MKKSNHSLIKNKTGLRDLLCKNTAIILTVFMISAMLVCWRTYEVLLASHNKEIGLFLDEEINLLNSRLESYKTNLENMKAVVNQSLKDDQKINEDVMTQIMRSVVIHQPYIYNTYFALSPAYAQKFYHQNAYAFLNHKNIEKLNTPDFSAPENIQSERYTKVDYDRNPQEVWYHIGKKGPGLQITDPYYDVSYMKVTMFSLIMAVQGAHGEFAGVVGADIPMSLWLTESFKRTAERGYRAFLVNQKGESLESLLVEDFSFPPSNLPSEFKLQAKGRLFNIAGKFEIEGDHGQIFDARSKPIWNNKYSFVVLRDRDRVIAPLKSFFMGILAVLLLILFLQVALSRSLSSEILKEVSHLFENFKLNFNSLTVNKDCFQPQHMDELRINELDDVRLFWDGFLQEFHTALSDSKKEKEKSEKAVAFQSSFLANMSHEIRTPMNAIVGMTDLLSETSLNESQKKYLNIFKRAADNLMRLLNDILDVAKIEAGSLIIESVNTDLDKVREDALMMFTHQAEQKKIQFNFVVGEDVPKQIKIDSFRLRQILYNLVGNALKFTHAGAVTVKFDRKNDERLLQIEVIDTGIGIPQHKMADIFKKFTQADTSTTRKFGGTGLGLSIVHSLVNLMQGSIELQSQEGSGSIFRVQLPYDDVTSITSLQESLAGTPAEVLFTPPKPSFEKFKVLLVDDVYENRMLVQFYLHSVDLRCEMAEDGQQAVEKYRQESFDLVLMDIQMPNKDGVTAMKEIKTIQEQNGHKTPIIALTAFAATEDNEKYVKAGFDGYLAKPLTKKIFTEALGRYLTL